MGLSLTHLLWLETETRGLTAPWLFSASEVNLRLYRASGSLMRVPKILKMVGIRFAPVLGNKLGMCQHFLCSWSGKSVYPVTGSPHSCLSSDWANPVSSIYLCCSPSAWEILLAVEIQNKVKLTGGRKGEKAVSAPLINPVCQTSLWSCLW